MVVYTVFNQASVGITSSAGDTSGYTMAMTFKVIQAAALTGIWFFSPPGAAHLPVTCGVMRDSDQATVAVNSAPSWSGAAGSGWVKCSFDGSVTLSPAQSYKACIVAHSGFDTYGASAFYWSGAGAGANGIVNGPLYAPGAAYASPGQDSFVGQSTDTLSFPTGSFHDGNYGIDVEISATVVPSTTTLLAAYSFDASNGADDSGNGHTLTDTTGGHVSFVTGKDGTGKAMHGDGAGGLGAVSFGQADSTSWLNSSVGDQITIMAWASVSPDEHPVISCGNTADWVDNLALWIIGGNMYVLVPDSTASQATHGSFTANTWTHFAVVYNSVTGVVLLYINAILAADTVISGVLNFPSAKFTVGTTAVYTSDSVVNGSVDDVRVYHGALTAAQIATCMNTSVGTKADPLVTVDLKRATGSGWADTGMQLAGSSGWASVKAPKPL
jgi:hypothetical protein